MKKNLGAKTILYPMPVLIIGTYDENGKPNAMNAAWGGISEETQISICVDDGHNTAKNVVKKGAFTQEEAEKKLEAWKAEKAKATEKTVSKLASEKVAAAKERLEAEKAVNKAKAAAVAAKLAAKLEAEAPAEEAPAEEAEAPAAE